MNSLLKALRSARPFALSAFAAILFSLALAAGFLQAAPLATRGGTGQALALRAALRALAPPAAHARSFQEMGVPAGLRRGPDGRFIYDKANLMRSGARMKPRASAAVGAQVDEAVQTFDVFNPPPGFTPTQGPGLAPTNLTPVWTADETMLVFSSNRTASGGVGSRFHLWAIPINGGTPVQLTDSAAGSGEFFPALSAGNNTEIAFTSDSQTPGVQNLYAMPFTAQTVNVSALTSPTNRATDPNAVAQGGTGFDTVGRPTFNPTNSDEIIFSAHSTAGTYAGHDHLYFLYRSTGGFNPSAPSLPAKLTDGPADDTDPAYSQDGQLVAFASTASTLGPAANPGPSSTPNASLLSTASPGALRNVFLVGGGGKIGFGNATNGGRSITQPGTDNFGPAWSSTRSNPYLNPAPGTEYIAFARGASPVLPHDIFYLPVLRNITAGGESGRSNEVGATPLLASAPIYQINAGGPLVPPDPNFPNQNYQVDGYSLIDPSSGQAVQPVPFNGGTADTPNPPPVVNTINDPNTPPSVYQTDRSGTFSYTFKFLTPAANYRVRLHLSDPKDTKAGQRIFGVAINGLPQSVIVPNPTTGVPTSTSSIDIVQEAQASPGRLLGLVSDGAGNPLGNVTITVTDFTTGATVATSPTPLVTSATPTTATGSASLVNYSGGIANGTYLVTATPAAGSGFSTLSEIVNITSGSASRADFTLVQGAGTLSGTVTDSTGKTPILGAAITLTDSATGAFVGTTPATVTTDNTGAYTLSAPPGTYDVSFTPPATSNYAIGTVPSVTITNGATTTQNVTLLSSATPGTVGTVAGLVTNGAGGLPLAGVTIKFFNPQGILVALTHSVGTTTAPAAPNGDGNPVNYSLLVPVQSGAGSLQFSAPGYTSQSQAVTVVSTPAAGTTPANAFVRADKALVSKTPTAGQNTAVVDEFATTALSRPIFDKNGLVLAAAGTIYVTFTPISGDPPIVQGIELVSDSNSISSNGFGGASGTSGSAAPTIATAVGGTLNNDPAQPRVTVSFSPSFSAGTPSSFNVYRTSGVTTSVNTPPLPSPAGTEGATPYVTNAPVTVDPATGRYVFTDTGVSLASEYFYQITSVSQQSVTPEAAPTAPTATSPGSPGNPATQLNTDDNPGQTGTAGNAYDDIYPTWSPFITVFSIAYSSNRTVSYTNPAAGNAQSETAVSIGQGQALPGGAAVGSAYAGILESQVLNLDPPTLLPYSGNEIVHVADSAGNTTRYGIQPGQPVTFVVRLSSREAGIDNAGGPNGGPNVYLQIKNPNSKYQDAQGLEHKVFAKDDSYRFQRNNPNYPYLLDSGSSAMLMNGGPSPQSNSPYAGFNQFPFNGQTFFDPQRGSIGGIDGPESDVGGGSPPGPATNKSDTISVGRDGGGKNPFTPVDAKGNPILDANKNPVILPGGDPNLFIPWGPEFECQVVNPQFGVNGATDTAPADFRDPYYLAGVDDQQPFSGLGRQRPTTDQTVSSTLTLPAEWLQLSQLPAAQQDGQGGVLYGVTWKTPVSGSDFYLDVIAFDKAVPPQVSSVAGGGSNWRIYDNVWGFSTAPSLNNNDILVVSDYALGQKFAATTFGGQSGLLNLVPKLYGAESYVTDIDTNLLPNAIYRNILYPGADGNNGNNYTPEALDIGTGYDAMNNSENFLFSITPLNGLGVGSYVDAANNDGNTVAGASAVRSQQYSLWRILSRGPIPASVYQAYEPKIVTQPAITDPAAPKGLTSVPAGSVPVANRCIVWLSPFTGDVLAGPGTLTDSNTQAALAGFVGAGGRLCVSGQNVASALTQNGTINNTAAGFLSTVLGATLAAANAGTHLPTATGQSATDNRITNLPFFDGQLQGNAYPEITPNDDEVNTTPGQRPIRISNNYGGNIFASIYGPLAPITPAYSGNWRTDGSLDQLGPYIQPFPATSNNSVVGRINTIMPNKGGHTDITLAPFVNPIGTTGFQINDPNAASEPGGAGLIYTENPFTGTGGTGSKVVFATFGLEGLSTEYYKQTISFKPNPIVYEARNQRQNILHNIVCYLRTGSITGTIRATTGNGNVGSGVPGVTVYVLSAFNAVIPGRGTFSATTDNAGNFRIDGLEPGNYTLAAYKTGFTRTTSNPGQVFTIEGDTTQSANLTISQSTGGVISGKVTDGVNPVAGATVTFTSSDGTVSQNATTDANGNYSLPNVPPTTYTGVATNAATGGVSPVSAPVTVTANSSATVNFVLKAGPGTVTGRVVDATTNLPIAGATVSFSSGNPPTVVTTATTNSLGVYTATGVPAGSYTLTASATGYGNSLPVSIAVTGNQTTNPADIPLGPVVNGMLGGLVTSTGSSAPVGGATVTIVNAGTGVSVTPAPVTASTATAGPDGSPLDYGPVTVPAGTYTVTASRNGVTTASQSVTVSGSQFTRVDFTGITGLAALHTFAAGLNFLSLPYNYSGSTFDSLFGALNTAPAGTTPNGNRSHVAVWDPTVSAYALDPTAPADAIRLGQGYWVFLKAGVGITQTGSAATGSVAVALHPSWNQIGVPNLTGVLVSSLTFDMGNGTAPLSFADAIGSADHVVSPTLYRYDGTAYQPVSATDTLQPWQAYWIKVFTPTTVRIPTGQ